MDLRADGSRPEGLRGHAEVARDGSTATSQDKAGCCGIRAQMTDRDDLKASADESLDLALQALVGHDAPIDLGARVLRAMEPRRARPVAMPGWRAAPWLAGLTVLLV